jgi:ArsR family transcriptional regulator, virulence genes transcriptional regulator
MPRVAAQKPMNMENMTAKAAEVASLLATMANPVRLLILCSLVEGEKPVHELVNNSGITQGAVSQHLTRMRNLKLVSTRRDGQSIYYSIRSKEVQQLLNLLYTLYCNDKPR